MKISNHISKKNGKKPDENFEKKTNERENENK